MDFLNVKYNILHSFLYCFGIHVMLISYIFLKLQQDNKAGQSEFVRQYLEQQQRNLEIQMEVKKQVEGKIIIIVLV